MEELALKILWTSVVIALFCVIICNLTNYDDIPKRVSSSVIVVFFISLVSAFASAMTVIWI